MISFARSSAIVNSSLDCIFVAQLPALFCIYLIAWYFAYNVPYVAQGYEMMGFD